jgi:hypothetical protein
VTDHTFLLQAPVVAGSPERLKEIQEAARRSVALRLSKGGARPGAGRNPKGNEPMLIHISPVVRKRIESLAKKEKTTLSAVIESRFAVQ